MCLTVCPLYAGNSKSLNFDLRKLEKQKKLLIEFVHLERSEIDETGEFDLEALFVRLGHAIDSIKAKRVVLDTIEALFSGLQNETILRAELRRLFRFLKDKGVTAIITGERGDGALTRHGLEEYVSDCVILLDHRVNEQLSTRRLRVVKYRGSSHGTNEYPFLIDEDGISVLPVTSLGLNHKAETKRIKTGITELDEMFDNKGFFKGSSILLSGTAGTGKTSIASSFVNEACKNGEKCIYFSFEESPDQLQRNMSSIGLNLKTWLKNGTLTISSSRPANTGLEMHLVSIHKLIAKIKPTIVVIDPLTSLLSQGNSLEISSMLTRMIDLLKTKGITALFTSLVTSSSGLDNTEVGVSSLIDTWLVLRELENKGRRTRGLYIIKSRGMPHSSDVREFVFGKNGIRLLNIDFKSPQDILPITGIKLRSQREV
jgi:circadian clock protein KaiC